MTSHVVVSAIDAERPATFSPVVLGDVLRGRLGFTGVIVSDALDMAGASAVTGIPEAAVRALAAGCDLLCIGSETTEDELLAVVEAVVAAVADGRLPVSRLEDAADRVALLSASFPPGPVSSERPGSAGVWADDLLSDGFLATRASDAWRAAEGVPCIVQVASDPNLAVGRVAWGPLAAGLTVPVSDVPEGAKVAVAARGLTPAHPAWRVASELRVQGHPTIVVDCGWPRGGADLVAYGGSVVVARALGRYLGVGT